MGAVAGNSLLVEALQAVDVAVVIGPCEIGVMQSTPGKHHAHCLNGHTAVSRAVMPVAVLGKTPVLIESADQFPQRPDVRATYR